eukprot:c46056_g1_i1 orf=21-281(+)
MVTFLKQDGCFEQSNELCESDLNVHHCWWMNPILSLHTNKVEIGIQRRLGHMYVSTNDCQVFDCLSLDDNATGLELKAVAGNSGPF